MVDSVQRYYDINTLLVHGKAPADRPDLQEKVDALPRLKLDKIEQMFLHFLRVPDYIMYVMKDGKRLLSLNQLINMVHNSELTDQEAEGWAPGMVHRYKSTVKKHPAIVDGVLELPEGYIDEDYDLNAAMDRMFKLRCWGSYTPNQACKELTGFLLNLTNPSGDISLVASTLDDFVDTCVDANVHPQDFGKTVVTVSDMQTVMETLGVPAFWSTFDHKNVTVVTPRGKSTYVTKVSMSVNLFAELYGKTGEIIKQMYTKANNIMIPDLEKPGVFVAL